MFPPALRSILPAFLLSMLLLGEALAESPPRWPHMPYLLTEARAEHEAENRMFVLASGITVSPGGRIWISWDSGGYGEGHDNFILLKSSDDGGETWGDPAWIVDPPFRAAGSSLWQDPGGRMWFFFNIFPLRNALEDQRTYRERFGDITALRAFLAENQGQGSLMFAMTTDDPDASSPEWSPPRLVAMDCFNVNKSTVLSDGTWVIPTGTQTRDEKLRQLKLPRPLFSTDEGKTFHFRGHVPIPKKDRNADEYCVVERRDGSLWLLSRTSYGIGESFSYDQGRTWTEMKPSDFAHTTSRFYIGRLHSGSLLFVKHGEIDERTQRREKLMAFLSDDDGESWYGGLVIDERKDISYPDVAQAADGTLYVTYDYQRHGAKEILMAAFTEADVAAGEVVSDEARFKVLVDKGLAFNPRHQGKKSAIPQWKVDSGEVDEDEAE